MSRPFEIDRYDICPNCNRARYAQPRPVHGESCLEKLAGAVVYAVHEGYGCDTGCCGHVIYVMSPTGEMLYREFAFEHSEEKIETSLGRVAARLGIRVSRDHCNIVEECYG